MMSLYCGMIKTHLDARLNRSVCIIVGKCQYNNKWCHYFIGIVPIEHCYKTKVYVYHAQWNNSNKIPNSEARSKVINFYQHLTRKSWKPVSVYYRYLAQEHRYHRTCTRNSIAHAQSGHAQLREQRSHHHRARISAHPVHQVTSGLITLSRTITTASPCLPPRSSYACWTHFSTPCRTRCCCIRLSDAIMLCRWSKFITYACLGCLCCHCGSQMVPVNRVSRQDK